MADIGKVCRVGWRDVQALEKCAVWTGEMWQALEKCAVWAGEMWQALEKCAVWTGEMWLGGQGNYGFSV